MRHEKYMHKNLWEMSNLSQNETQDRETPSYRHFNLNVIPVTDVIIMKQNANNSRKEIWILDNATESQT